MDMHSFLSYTKVKLICYVEIRYIILKIKSAQCATTMLLFCSPFSMKVGPPGQAPSWRENDLYPWRTSSKQQFLAYTIVTNTSIYIDCVRIPFGIVQRQQIKMLIRSSCWPEFLFLLFPRNA